MFNVPKAPWWGGQFERLIGPIKASLYRTIGKAQLTWAELEEVLLDIKIIINNRPLTYIEEEIDHPILTPNNLILGRDVNFPDAAPHESESETIKKRHKYIKRCKEGLWKRWKREYLVALREKYNLKNNDKAFKINVGDVVLIKGEEKNRRHWKIGNVNHLYSGKENIIRVAQLRLGKKLIDRPIQLPYPLELHCESITPTSKDENKNELNPSVTEFRPKRTAAETTKWRLKNIAIENDDGDI